MNRFGPGRLMITRRPGAISGLPAYTVPRTWSHIPTPLTGPSGEELATDVARFGSDSAARLLVMVSGVHGVEGFSGSATQVGWIAERRFEALPPDKAVLMIHLINPWGAAHLRRYNEDNVDLCRNFLDFSKALARKRELCRGSRPTRSR